MKIENTLMNKMKLKPKQSNKGNRRCDFLRISMNIAPMLFNWSLQTGSQLRFQADSDGAHVGQINQARPGQRFYLGTQGLIQILAGGLSVLRESSLNPSARLTEYLPPDLYVGQAEPLSPLTEGFPLGQLLSPVDSAQSYG